MFSTFTFILVMLSVLRTFLASKPFFLNILKSNKSSLLLGGFNFYKQPEDTVRVKQGNNSFGEWGVTLFVSVSHGVGF